MILGIGIILFLITLFSIIDVIQYTVDKRVDRDLYLAQINRDKVLLYDYDFYKEFLNEGESK